MNNIKIVIISNDDYFHCGIIKKVDDKLINKLLTAPLDSPVKIIIYKNEHSNQVHFVTSQGFKFDVKDDTRKFYFDEFYNRLVKSSKEAVNHGN